MGFYKDGNYYESEIDYKNSKEQTANANAALDLFLMIFMIFGKVVGLILGFIIGIFLKLGIVGRIILSLFVTIAAIAALLVVRETVFTSELSDSTRMLIDSVISIIAIFVGFWFFKWHFPIIKNIPIANFSGYVAECFSICFYGSIFIMVLRVILRKEDNWLIGLGIPFLGALIVWFVKTMPYKNSDYAPQPTAKLKKPKGVSNAVPAALPSAENRLQPGDYIWARWNEDNNLYFAQIMEVTSQTVYIKYYDGNTDEVNKKDIFYFAEAQSSGLTANGNWKNIGAYYPCKILEINDSFVTVEYIEDEMKEKLPYSRLVFGEFPEEEEEE